MPAWACPAPNATKPQSSLWATPAAATSSSHASSSSSGVETAPQLLLALLLLLLLLLRLRRVGAGRRSRLRQLPDVRQPGQHLAHVGARGRLLGQAAPQQRGDARIKAGRQPPRQVKHAVHALEVHLGGSAGWGGVGHATTKGVGDRGCSTLRMMSTCVI